MGKKKGGAPSSTMGVVYIVLSLALDGVTAGFQKRLKTETAKVGVKPKPYDFMLVRDRVSLVVWVFVNASLSRS